MKNNKEQAFCTKLGAWLKKTNHPQSMLIECKVVVNRGSFNPETIRKSQIATLNRLDFGAPLVHKISDGAVGSKLVDMIYISGNNDGVRPFVAVSFGKSGHAYLIPWAYVSANIDGYLYEPQLQSFKIW